MHPVRVVISGVFCTGKTTLLKNLREDPELQLETLFADATRPMRPQEREGDPYKFIGKEEYDRRQTAGQYFYTVTFNGNSYATTHSDANKLRWAIDIVAENWPKFKGLEGTLSIYLKPPSLPVLIERAKERKETDEAIQKRVQATKFDDPAANDFMYQIDSSESKEAVFAKVKRIVKKHMTRVLGIGTPSMDLHYSVPADFLKHHDIKPGGIRILDWIDYRKVLDTLESAPEIMTGGSTSNTMKGLARLYQPSEMCGRLGADPLGKDYLKAVSALGLKSRFITATANTQQIGVLITPDRQRSFLAHLAASAEFCRSDLPAALFQGVNLVHLEGYLLYNEDDGLLEHALYRAKQAGALVSLNLCDAQIVGKKREIVNHLVSQYVDILFANHEEAEALTGLTPVEACKKLSAQCHQAVVVTCGEKGCYVADRSNLFHCPAIQTEVVDTTGASDLFASGFLYSFLQGRTLEECAKSANLLGSACVSVKGTDIPEQVWKELRKEML